ncbi:hypothetical protein IIA79_03715, partial [bacterium]|nr:hypothetical protein [bacterium]
MSKSAARAGGRASGSGRMRRRSPLLGWGIAIAALLILGGGAWWYVSRHLGDLVSGMLKQRAGDSLNGRLEFSKLTIDLAGRAVLEDAAIYPEGGNEPLITCPRAVATLDFLTFFGPNRGKRAVVVDLHEPRFTLVREPGGRFNLARLLKPSEEEGEPIGVSVHLHNAQIEFTDWDLLGQSIWNVPEQSGLASKLLDELGNPASPSVEIPIHEELLTISGSVAINPERQELAFNLDIAREGGGGAVSVKGASALDGGEFDVDLDLEEVELTSVKSYANSLFPLLALSEAFPNSSDESRRPYLAGRITRGSINLTKLRQEAVQAGWTLELAELRYLSAHLPELYFPHLAANYSSDSKKLNTDFTLHALGCTVQGKPALDLASDELSGELSISGGDLRMLAREFTAKDLPFSGTAGAAVTLAGSLSAPRLEAKLSGKNLAYKQIKLGALEGTVAMNTPTIKLMDVKFSGGDLPLKINGSLELGKNNGKFSLLAGPLTAAHALDLAGRFGIEGDTASMDIKGSIRASAEVTLKGGKPSTALRFWSDRLMLAGLTLESADLRGTLAPPNFNIDVAEAVLVTAEQIDLAGFTSEGPLQLDVRASGSISKLESGSAALALVGEAATRNLAPEAAKLSFKVLGPANDPEIRVQIKTAHADNPLLVSG